MNNNNILAYKGEKLRILKDFCIKLNKEQKRKLACLKTEISIDNYIHKIIFEAL